MSERRRSVDRKNKSRALAFEASSVSSIQKRPRAASTKVEVTCPSCGWTKQMTQAGYDIHRRKAHNLPHITVGATLCL